MTDTPVQPPAARFERVVAALGNLARPWVLYVAAGSAALSGVLIVTTRLDLWAGAALQTAQWSGVALLYGAKAAEERLKVKDQTQAAARIAEAGASPSDT